MSYDAAETLSRFAKQRGIAMTLLSDPNSAIIAAFDLQNPRYPPGSRWHGLALPAVFVVSAEGIVTHRWSDPNYRWRPEPDDVLQELRRAQ